MTQSNVSLILLPAVDVRDGHTVRAAERDPRYCYDPLTLTRRRVNEGAEWLHPMDLDAEPLADVIRQVGVLVELSGGKTRSTR
jgi:phosphoribosylformimino-5-aminoimidazole carboxamide ribonucleotide (ProFAR) isomerase